MEPFEHINAASVDDAVALLGAGGAGQARAIAGGTDLLTMLKAGLHTPDRLVNLKTIPGLDEIAVGEDGVRLGALVSIAAIERNPLIRERYTALAEAAAWTASPQLRNMGTIGGNLAQETRCWYFRNDSFNCWLKGGDRCFARDGENQHHAIFTSMSPCVSAHPSDPAVALLALDAEVLLRSGDAEKTLPLADFYTAPTEGHRQLTALAPGDLILGVRLPAVEAARTSSTYITALERATWAFALAGVAVVITWAADATENGGRVVEKAAIALGGVAPIPRRATAAEQYLIGKQITPDVAAEAGLLAIEGAEPLAHNRYKLRLVRGLVARALKSFV